MIDRKTEPVIGVERGGCGSTRTSPPLPGRQLILCTGRFGKDCKDYFIMHVKAFKLPDKNLLFYPNNRDIRGRLYIAIAGVLDPTHILPICGMEHCMNHQVSPNGLIPLIGTDLLTIMIRGNLSEPLLNGCAPAVHSSNKFHNKKNRPFLTRLVGDPIGKDADGETTIGEQNNVTKYIN